MKEGHRVGWWGVEEKGGGGRGGGGGGGGGQLRWAVLWVPAAGGRSQHVFNVERAASTLFSSAVWVLVNGVDAPSTVGFAFDGGDSGLPWWRRSGQRPHLQDLGQLHFVLLGLGHHHLCGVSGCVSACATRAA